jgi:hypothetical protein
VKIGEIVLGTVVNLVGMLKTTANFESDIAWKAVGKSLQHQRVHDGSQTRSCCSASIADK